ncbi:hypothetical protein EON65_19245 [archaeon]|nr:MAG: hypothetical protein EON65_19245 [archaeon]
MIQYNFPSMQPAPVRALLAISPREATSGPIPPPSHKKSSSFTRRIYEHGGPFKDTSLEAATRKKQAHSSHFEKQFGSCDELVSEWDGLLEDIKTIAVEIASSQQVMAKQLSRYYASITVQLALRGYIARQSLRRLKCERVVKAFILFKRYFRKRVRAAHRIRTSYHSYHIRQSFKRIFAMHMAAKVVQRVFRNRKQSRLLNIFVKMLGIFKRLRDHVMLFGVRRAVKRIVSITQPQRYGTPPIIVRFLYKTLRRRRMRM